MNYSLTSKSCLTKQSKTIAVAEDPALWPGGEVFGFAEEPDREDHPEKRDCWSLHDVQDRCLILVSCEWIKFIEGIYILVDNYKVL